MFEILKYYYPVFIPIFLAVLTVLQRITAQRFEATLDNALKIYTDLTLGLFAFILWAYGSPSFRTGRVILNQDYYIDTDFINILLLGDIALLVAGIFIARREWQTPKKSRLADAAMLVATLFFISVPLQIKKPLNNNSAQTAPKPAHSYLVGIPYRDDSLAEHVGPKRWGDRLLYWYESGIQAHDANEAESRARSDFSNSQVNSQLYIPRNAQSKPVTMLNDLTIIKPTDDPQNAQETAGQ